MHVQSACPMCVLVQKPCAGSVVKITVRGNLDVLEELPKRRRLADECELAVRQKWVR